MYHAYVGFGSNLGDRAGLLESAARKLCERGHSVLRCSPLYLTEPWGGAEGGEFINAVLEMTKRQSAAGLLQDLMAVETELGRVRTRPNTERTCDLDLLLWGDETVCADGLTVPHPRLHLRRFVLAPLCDLIPGAIHPAFGQSFAALLAACPDSLQVRPFQPSHIPPCP